MSKYTYQYILTYTTGKTVHSRNGSYTSDYEKHMNDVLIDVLVKNNIYNDKNAVITFFTYERIDNE